MQPTQASFPQTRARRVRASAPLRALCQENNLSVNDLIWPIFVVEGSNQRQPIASMPGVERLSIDLLVEAARQARDLGIPAICIFPYTDPALRTECCREAWNANSLSNRAIAAVKSAVPEVAIMTDIALDPYNSLGHDGLVQNGIIVNDETVDALVKMALSQAAAGADILGPSDMMDGRIYAIRQAVEAEGYKDIAIMSYAAKYASSFYGPFRDAVGASAALKGDKKTYQINPANSDEAMRQIQRDLSEGADMVIVKPGMAYLDICARAKTQFGAPTFAYQVSGEYAMIAAADANGWLNGDAVMMESMLAFRRAGCDGVLTYFAPRLAKAING